MKPKPFSCPCCGETQSLKRLFLLSNFSHWKCPNCSEEIKLKRNSKSGIIVGIISALITYCSMFACLYFLELSIFKSLAVTFIFALIIYLSGCYYFYHHSKFVKKSEIQDFFQ